MSLPLSGFPHLFDMILEAAPRESLLPLRGVCRAFKARVDAHMLGHIVVFSSITSHNDMFIHGPNGERIPCTMEWNLAHPGRDDYRRYGDPKRDLDSEEGKPHLVATRQQLHAVRILDIRGWVSYRAESVLETLHPEVSRIIVDVEYEIMDGQYSLILRQSVNFGAWETKVHCPSHGWLSYAPRAVVVVEYEDHCRWCPHGFLPEAVEQLILIFKPRDESYEVEGLVPDSYFMEVFGTCVLSQIMRVKLTLVDILKVPLELLGLDPAEASNITYHPDGGRRSRKSTVRALLTEAAMESRRGEDETAPSLK